MLTKELKSKIDRLRNKIVGTITDPMSQVDIISYSLLYKFMYDMDQESLFIFAVNGITKYFSTMYGKKMNINTIANHGIDWKQPSSFKKKLIKSIPKGRMMKTQDLYGIIDYLCSSENTYMNGSTIVLDGGYSSW